MRLKIISTFLVALWMGGIAAAQNKISGIAQCAKPDPQHMIEVPDRPNHSVAVGQSKCTWTKPLEIGGMQNKEGVATVSNDISGNRSQDRGYYVDSMANGDKAFVSYHGTSTLKDGMPETLQGSWTYTGGTGKLKSLKGKGTYKGKAGPEGVTYDVEGEYTLPPQ